MDARTLISSPKWLQLHGLKRKRLTLSQILSDIGFKHREDYISALGKPVSSRYGEGLFQQFRNNGNIYNVTANKERLHEFANHLAQAIKLYKERLNWLTSGSQQIFGVIQEHSIAIVLVCSSMTKAHFDLCRDALCMVLKEQVSHIARFNIIRAAKDTETWQEATVHVNEHSLQSAVDWIWNLELMPAMDKTSPAEAVIQAMRDKTVEAVYFFAVGDVPESMKELLLKKILTSQCPVHTVSFNAKEKETIQFLKELAKSTAGRFHAFALRDDLKRDPELPSGSDVEKDYLSFSTFSTPRQLKGGLPPGTGIQEDVFLVWKEMEEARNTLGQIQALLIEDSKAVYGEDLTDENTHLNLETKQEDCLSSKAWLQKYGLKARKLDFYHALADCAFRHSDGIINVKTKPSQEAGQTDTNKNSKLINAKYCDRFAHALWKDGSIVHVYVSTEKYRWYEERMKLALEQIERRIDWLQQGSRELFGAILEDQVYVLIDTSHSMKDKLLLVKDKIFQLMHEQLKHKSKFNFVKFDSHATAWREKLAEVNEQTLESAWCWVKELQVGGSTNTLGALQFALADGDTQAVYLLTDGRPDQPPKTILAHVQLQQPVPLHTISFNCSDMEANRFLYELSRETGGRFHSYSSNMNTTDAPQPYMSEDIYLLKQETEQGKEDMKKAQKLHAECLMLDWYYNGEHNLKKSEKHNRCHSSCQSQAHSQNLEMPQRPHSALNASQVSYHSHRAMSLENVNLKQLQKKKSLHADLNAIDGKSEQKKTNKFHKDPLDMSSARWLKNHSLVAKRLTIMDALAPTAVAQTATYVPILDKHVVSKVFDEILPLAHVGKSKKQITLINPLAVDLLSYQRRLQRVIKGYERRLSLIIWRAFSQEERDKFASDEPVPFRENREALLQALDRLGWPISLADITLLEDEIQTGETYLQQASDLHKAAKERDKKLPEVQKNDCDDEGVHHKHLKNDDRAMQQSKKLDTLKGQRVIARSEIDGFYYPGTVIKSTGSKKALVDFINGNIQITPINFIIPLGGAMPCPPLKVGDFVLARTETKTETECYMPAVVMATPRKGEIEKLYTVLKYNNRREHLMRSWMIKINQMKYTFACRYIRQAQMVDHTIPSVQIVQPITKPNVKHENEEKNEKIHTIKEQKSRKNRSDRTKKKSLSEIRGSEFKDENNPSDAEVHCKPNVDHLFTSQGHAEDEGPNLEKEDELCLRIPLPPTPASSVSPSPRSERCAVSPTSQISTPLSSARAHSAASSKEQGSFHDGSSPTPVSQKVKELAGHLQQALADQLNQQEKIQELLKQLASLNDKAKSDITNDKSSRDKEQADLLHKITELMPITSRRNSITEQNGEDAIPEDIKQARQNLPKLAIGHTVLARSSYDGWYYQGNVVHDCTDDSYFVRSRTTGIDRAWREDIIADADDLQVVIKEKDPVIGLHPLYPDHYCPGAVLKIMPDLTLEVRYYDGVEALVPRERAYWISAEKFERDVAYILECEARWVGEAVIARDDETGTYHLAEVQERVGDGKQYLIRWADGKMAVQNASFIFGKFTRPHLLHVNDFVLTLANPTSLTYLPGIICACDDEKLVVKLCNSKR
ncbi:von Willebrand factor A domain-containing protein 3B [Protopterus annectens]|uniref:von Willebrand factor A domain-containing protein 3B n=1 Tax=Protopterus annectens TaxID=7888 RepID=UPI001CFBB6B5|nr:von Willebrand factor A domain-containing protein 3B [Protopterus annectens]